MLCDDRVVLGLSGGGDSAVAAVLLHRAIGKNLYCIFVDSGLLRKNEFDSVLESYKGMGLNVKGVKAHDRFLGDLAGVTDPEKKRKIIGRDFVEVFNAEAKQIENVKWLAQGTIYPDVVESASASVKGPAAMIKSHHNVGGLPEEMRLKIVEPQRLLFKDEVRRVGPRDPYSWRYNPGEGGNSAECGQNLYRCPARVGTLRPGMAGGSDSAAREERRRNGR